MTLIKVAVGNSEEAFIEERLTPGLNIISSDDNNRGKTIIIQSMMYALGNEPTFPTSFEYQQYYYYVEFEVSDIHYHICRFRDNFVLKYANTFMIFDNVSELKHYWNRKIFPLPSITKNEITRIVDPVLFFQLFFVGQDKKDTSNIAHQGLYNKRDYENMLFSFMGIGAASLSQDEIETLKSALSSLTDERKLLLQQHKILKSSKAPIAYLSSTSDRLAFGEKVTNLEKLQSKIAELRKRRNLISTRKSKWEITIKELRSLNRTITCGELRCMDCNSTNISFCTGNDTKSSYTFDVSTTEMRNEIISSISEKIDSYSEEIDRLTNFICAEQSKLHELMEDENVSLESIVAYKQDVLYASDAESRIKEIEEEISQIKTKLTASKDASIQTREKQNDLLASIVKEMNILYQQIDPDGNIVYDSLFTQKNVVYSGSEATVFQLVKLLAIQSVTSHTFPIIIDSFRAEDLSTPKENIVLQLVSQLSNQIIFTTTTKNEEIGKYNNISWLCHIDYSSYTPSKILTPHHLQEFKYLLKDLSINIEDSNKQESDVSFPIETGSTVS